MLERGCDSGHGTHSFLGSQVSFPELSSETPLHYILQDIPVVDLL